MLKSSIYCLCVCMKERERNREGNKRTQKNSFISRRNSYRIVGAEKRRKGGSTEVFRNIFSQKPERRISRGEGEAITLLLDRIVLLPHG